MGGAAIEVGDGVVPGDAVAEPGCEGGLACGSGFFSGAGFSGFFSGAGLSGFFSGAGF